MGLCNLGSQPYEIQPGERVAQLVVMPVCPLPVRQVEELDRNPAGGGGFGSTGKTEKRACRDEGSFMENLRMLRLERRLSQMQVQKETGINQGSCQNMSGAKPGPPWKTCWF